LHLHHKGVVSEHVSQDGLLLAQLLRWNGRVVVLAPIVAVVGQSSQHVKREEKHEAEAEDEPANVVLADLAPLDVQKRGAERVLQYLLLTLVDERV